MTNIAEISIEIQKDGTPLYIVTTLGHFASQGGVNFTYGTSEHITIQSAISEVEKRMIRERNIIIDEILKND